MLTMKEASYNTVSQQQLDAQFMQQYQLQHHIGSGGYGFVMSAIDRITKRKVAVKFINKAKNPRLHNQVPSEIKILQEIHHPSVIEYIDHFEDSLYHYLIMELYGDVWSDGPKLSITPAHRRVFSSDLFECIESHVKLTELQAQKIFKQIAQCVSDLSDLGIYHRDIKDENIVVDAKFKVNIVKLIDFGAAIQVDPYHTDTTIREFYGTTAFASPEILRGHAYKPEPAEVWSLGILLLTLLHGQESFASPTQLISGNWVHPSSKQLKCSDMCWHLLNGLLKYHPQERLTIRQILLHPWTKQ